ncbi:MAG: hypothetical protein QXG58_07280 [Candidatus Bathyarchaeia archaeon]
MWQIKENSEKKSHSQGKNWRLENAWNKRRHKTPSKNVDDFPIIIDGNIMLKTTPNHQTIKHPSQKHSNKNNPNEKKNRRGNLSKGNRKQHNRHKIRINAKTT